MVGYVRILGVDPGYGRIGYALIDIIGNKFNVVDFGVIETDKNKPFYERLEEIHIEISKLIDKYEPKELAIENLYFFKNARTAFHVGEARGVIILTAVEKKLRIFEYTPYQVKQAITGYGNASKSQIQNALKIIFHLSKKPSPDDAADALAIAFCHSNHRRMILKDENK